MPASHRDSWTPIAGIAAALTFVVGVAMAADSPDSDSSDAKVIAWYAKHSHRVGVIVGVFVLMFFGLFLLWFAAGLRAAVGVSKAEESSARPGRGRPPLGRDRRRGGGRRGRRVLLGLALG